MHFVLARSLVSSGLISSRNRRGCPKINKRHSSCLSVSVGYSLSARSSVVRRRRCSLIACCLVSQATDRQLENFLLSGKAWMREEALEGSLARSQTARASTEKDIEVLRLRGAMLQAANPRHAGVALVDRRAESGWLRRFGHMARAENQDRISDLTWKWPSKYGSFKVARRENNLIFACLL
ncbi:hypothetical protein HDK77DRAFT_434222 [Phyllosticta capitalensis]